MKTGIVIIAHAPLATALRQCVAHVFPDRASDVTALDIHAEIPVEQSLAQARAEVEGLGKVPILLLTDVMGATPCNIARQLLAGRQARMLAGVNVPMLLRAVNYQDESLDAVTGRAMQGGSQGVQEVWASGIE